MTRALSDLIPDPDTRAFIGRVYRAWGVEWAAVVTQAIYEGVLIDMGYVELFAPCPTPGHAGHNIANHPCELCGHPQARLEDCKPVVSRWAGHEEMPAHRAGQMNLEAQAQLELC